VEFLDVIEEIKAEEASISKLFGGEGRAVRTGRRGADPRYKEKLLEAITFIQEVVDGRRPVSHLQEAMSSSASPK
jgi:hypothetical protein